jgi:hypothetical protein
VCPCAGRVSCARLARRAPKPSAFFLLPARGRISLCSPSPADAPPIAAPCVLGLKFLCARNSLLANAPARCCRQVRISQFVLVAVSSSLCACRELLCLAYRRSPAPYRTRLAVRRHRSVARQADYVSCVAHPRFSSCHGRTGRLAGVDHGGRALLFSCATLWPYLLPCCCVVAITVSFVVHFQHQALLAASSMSRLL